jgi:hypothetical protein
MFSRFVCLLLAITFFLLHAEHSKEPLYTQAGRLVIRLEQALPAGGFKPVGTAFFVQDSQKRIYIVTARHVVSGRADLRARVPSFLTASGKTDVIELRLPGSRWIFHEDEGDEKTMAIDVAVMKLPGIKDRGIVTLLYCAKDCPKDEYNQLAADPEPPDQVVIFGFPEDLGFTLKEPRPMGRMGAVALTADEPYISTLLPDKTRKFFAKGAFLIDARMFGGNSGSPIIVYGTFKQLTLAGLVTASNRDFDFGIGTPVSQIAQTIDRAQNSDGQFPAWHHLILPAPTK